ncbi:Plasmid stabilization system protein [Sporomusa ovata DSM 2662]|uniref:type II toxin-antitoxin system RelE/ParE family toxin n=1 Tax=Sporomusa ovata TaxID=2378 RepID=UPI0003888240|nr:type II toxin-antitoxin system RelE/ParE family toxin [Sporomusa ovata]EQB25983.1 plasmid stabilization system protein [Sporomusa ovata DSM 2662]
MEINKYQVKIAPEAAKDLKEIMLYIARQNPRAAQNLAQTIRNKINSVLGTNPFLCPIVTHYPGLMAAQYRHLVIHKNYTVLFVIMGQTVEVRHIMHNKRDFNLL